jgi:hypothetical protein
MGGRGSYDHSAECIPIEKREYVQIGSFNGIKILEGITIKNGKPPVMSNTADTVYAIWSDTAKCIKSVLYYKNHVLYKAIDIVGEKSHWHNVKINASTGEIGRKTHDHQNFHELSETQWKLVNQLMEWKKK